MAFISSPQASSESGLRAQDELRIERPIATTLAVALGLGLLAPMCVAIGILSSRSAHTGEQHALLAGLAALCFLGVVGVIAGVHLRIARPIRDLAHATQVLANGDLDVHLPAGGKSEIGALTKALKEMMSNLRNAAEQADAIACGDYSVEIKPRSNKDALGVSLFEMTRTLRDVVSVSEAVAAGDYSAEVTIRSEENLLGRALNQMIHNLRGVVEQVDLAGSQMVCASREQAEGAKNQSVATEEVTSTVSELLTSAKKMAENATGVAEQAERTVKECVGGKTSIERTVQGIRGIHERVQRIASHMLELSNKSRQISGVLDMITELSEQTNLLSLNASIEAAGSGEAGKRFAVVASEIRKLAERATSSTGEIRSLIDGIQETVNATIVATEEGAKAVEEGVRLTEEVDKSFGQIAGQVTSTTQSAKAIEMGSRQQATAIEQMEGAIRNVDAATQKAAETARQLDIEAQALIEVTRGIQNRHRMEHRDSRKGGKSLNCWEFKHCGREAGGANVHELGQCPAYPDGGKSCASIAGTFCGGEVQGTYASKRASCLTCDFYNSEHYGHASKHSNEAVRSGA